MIQHGKGKPREIGILTQAPGAPGFPGLPSIPEIPYKDINQYTLLSSFYENVVKETKAN